MKVSSDQKIARGYARNQKDEDRLRAEGIKTIYRADKGETLGKFKMRPGELLGVASLRAFGEVRRDMVAAIAQVHKWGAAVIDLHDKPLRSDRDGAAMLDRALIRFSPSPAHAAEMQRRSVIARAVGRMGKRDALIIWRNPKLGTAEAIDLMRGWSQTSAYKLLGKRYIPSGRRSK